LLFPRLLLGRRYIQHGKCWLQGVRRTKRNQA